MTGNRSGGTGESILNGTGGTMILYNFSSFDLGSKCGHGNNNVMINTQDEVM